MKVYEVGKKVWMLGTDYSCKRGVITDKRFSSLSQHKDNAISYIVRFDDGKTVVAFGYQLSIRIPAAKKLLDSILLGV